MIIKQIKKTLGWRWGRLGRSDDGNLVRVVDGVALEYEAGVHGLKVGVQAERHAVV